MRFASFARVSKVVLAFVAPPALAGLAASCVSVLGVHDLPGTCGAVAYAELACASCVDSACCAEAGACARDAVCADAFGCEAGCGASDLGCRARCRVATEAIAPGSVPLDALEACARRACGDACFACTAYVAPGADGSCATCASGRCCDLARACAADATCDAVAACTAACDDPDCISRCLARGDLAARDRVVALTKCAVGCTACGVGASWSCVDAYTLPLPVAPRARWTLEVESYPSTPLDGVPIVLCAWSDGACAKPLAHGDVREGGATFALDLPVSAPFSGFFKTGTDLVNLLVTDHVVRDGFERWVVLDKAVATAALGAVGGTSNGTTDAALIVIVEDCRGATAPGVAITLDPPFDGEPVYYLGGAAPSATAKATSTSGIAAAVLHAKAGALPAARVTLRGTIAGASEVVRAEAPLLGGALTQVIARPSARD